MSIQKQFPATCVTSQMEYLNLALGNGSRNQGYYDLDYMQTYKDMTFYRNGVKGKNVKSFVKKHFRTEKFSTYQESIDRGMPVMTDMFVSQSGTQIFTHNVLVVCRLW